MGNIFTHFPTLRDQASVATGLMHSMLLNNYMIFIIRDYNLQVKLRVGMACIGPINTMLLNGREVGRAIMCSFDLAFNQTKTYMSLRIVPIIDILYQLQVRSCFKSLTSIIRHRVPIKKCPHFLFFCSLYKLWPISIKFCTQYTETICNLTVLCHLAYIMLPHYLGKFTFCNDNSVNQIHSLPLCKPKKIQFFNSHCFAEPQYYSGHSQ